MPYKNYKYFHQKYIMKIMIARNFLIVINLLISVIISAQSVGIGTITPDSSAILELSSTDKGFLMPRMTTAQRDAILSPPEGLKVFNMDDKCEDTYSHSAWNKKCNETTVANYIIGKGEWIRRNDITSERSYPFYFSIGNKFYIGGGEKLNNDTAPGFYVFDTQNKEWTDISNSSFSFARKGMFGFAMNGKGYAGGGYTTSCPIFGPCNYNSYSSFYEFDPATNNWTQKASLPFAVEYGCSFIINNKGYVTGGKRYDAVSDQFIYNTGLFQYDANSNLWQIMSSLPVNKVKATAFSIGLSGYIGLGEDENGTETISFYRYDVGSNSWALESSFPGNARKGAISFSQGTHGYTALGDVDDKKIYKFTPGGSYGSWETIITNNNPFSDNDFKFVEQREGAASALIDSIFYISVGKNADDIRKDLWQSNPFSSTKIKENKTTNPSDVVFSNTGHWLNKYTSYETVPLVGEKKNVSNNYISTALSNIDVLFDSKIYVPKINGKLDEYGNISNIVMQTSGSKIGIGIKPLSLLHLKGIDNTNSRHIRLESNSSSDYTSIYAGTNFIIENSSEFGDFYFKNGFTGENVFSVSPAGNMEVYGSLTGAVKFIQNIINISTTGSTQTFTVGNKTYIKATCSSGDCLTCSGSGCPDLILSDGESDGHILVLRGDADSNKGLYMPGNNASSTNYRLTANFQLANNNFITLMWISDENEWREISRAVY